MNPFELIMQMLGMGGGGAPAPAQPNPMEAAVGQPPAQPPPTPPASVVPPVQPPNFRAEEPGTIGSMIGGTARNWGLFRGSPSQAEYQAGQQQQAVQMEAESKQAMASVLPEIERIRAQNPNAQPHEITKQIFASPAFMQSAMKVPASQMQKFVSELVTQSSAPPPTFRQIGTTYGSEQNGKFTAQGQVQTPDIQKYEYLRTLPQGLRDELLTPRKTQSEKALALQSALQNKYINHYQYTMAMAGLVKSETVRDENGAVIESRQTIPQLPTGPGQPAPTPGASNAMQPAPAQGEAAQQSRAPWAPQPQQTAQAQPPGQVPAQTQGKPPEISDQSTGGGLINDPTEIFDVSSFGGKLATSIGGITGNLGAKYSPQRLDYAKSKILAMKRAARALKDSRSFKVEIEDLDKQLPDEDSFFSNSLKAINQTIAYRETLENKRNQILAFTQNKANPVSLRREAQQHLPALSAAEATIPGTMEQLKARRAEIEAGGGGVGVSEVLKTVPSLSEASEVARRGSEGLKERNTPKAIAEYPAKLQTLDPKGLAAEEVRPGKTLQELRALEAELIRRSKGGK